MNTPNLYFLQTIAPLLAKTPPVVGISSNQQVRITFGIDRQILQAHIACPQSPMGILQRDILSAIDQAQTLRHQRIQSLISQYAQVTKLSLWDIEATLLALRHQLEQASDRHSGTLSALHHQPELSPINDRQLRHPLFKGGWGVFPEPVEWDLLDPLAAAHQNYLQLQENYKSLPDPALGIFL
jgi:hypothetical protein